MNDPETLALLEAVKSGAVEPSEAIRRLKLMPFEDIGYANVDHHRSIRQGVREVIFAQGKTPEQIKGILASMAKHGDKNILLTRLSREAYLAVCAEFPIEYHDDAHIGVALPSAAERVGCVVVATGGTSDIPVAEEAAVTAETLGSNVVKMYDVGVLGIHRLMSRLDILSSARAIVAVAGMEGALASVIGGLVSCPVIAVPTSIGYGASFGGVAALLSMLNSCASGVSVVNIDNGFGAGYIANMINKTEGIQ